MCNNHKHSFTSSHPSNLTHWNSSYLLRLYLLAVCAVHWITCNLYNVYLHMLHIWSWQYKTCSYIHTSCILDMDWWGWIRRGGSTLFPWVKWSLSNQPAIRFTTQSCKREHRSESQPWDAQTAHMSNSPSFNSTFKDLRQTGLKTGDLHKHQSWQQQNQH